MNRRGESPHPGPPMGQFQGENHCRPKGTPKTVSHFPKKHLYDPQDSWENNLGTDESKSEHFRRCAFHNVYDKTNSNTKRKHGGSIAIAWVGFAAYEQFVGIDEIINYPQKMLKDNV
ncbi:hypothetical protein AMECASPLE_032010 [Ameca splendens]|uniref:Uncharacterized protein n=1 Tax=Ameca splendens TaxID=208324 RepID=A0ABV0Y6G4_9TELE